MIRKITPAISSQSWCSTRPNAVAVVAAARVAARTVRLRLACWVATRATTPNFRAVETLVTASILSVSGATMTQTCAAIETVQRLQASKRRVAGLRPTFQTDDVSDGQ